MAWTVDSDRVSIPATVGSSTKIGLKDAGLVLFIMWSGYYLGLSRPVTLALCVFMCSASFLSASRSS